MPCMSIKYVRNLRPIMRDRNKNWRQTSFRNVYVGRGTLARKKKSKTEKKDMFGSDEVTWVEGYPLRKKMLRPSMKTTGVCSSYIFIKLQAVDIYTMAAVRSDRFSDDTSLALVSKLTNAAVL